MVYFSKFAPQQSQGPVLVWNKSKLEVDIHTMNQSVAQKLAVEWPYDANYVVLQPQESNRQKHRSRKKKK